MRLLDLPLGASARIIGFDGGDRLQAKLIQYGLYPGDCLTLLRRAPLRGPLLIRVNGRELALGRSVAEHVRVEAGECVAP